MASTTVFTPLLARQKEKEPSSDLLSAFQSLAFFSAKASATQQDNFAVNLLQFVKYANEANDLSTYLILLKLLMCLWEEDTHVDCTSVGNEELVKACRSVGRSKLSPNNLTKTNPQPPTRSV